MKTWQGRSGRGKGHGAGASKWRRVAARARPEMLVALALVAAVWAVYGQTGTFGYLTYDDGSYVWQNPAVRGGLTPESVRWAFTSFHATNWHPLTWLSHLLDVQLFGLRPGPHHLVSVGWHAANSVLLFLVLRRLTGALWRSALVAGLFALHPAHVESAAWIAERKDVLSAFFLLLALYAYARYADARRAPWYAGALAAFALGLAAKPMGVTLPFLLLLLDVWPLGRWGRGERGEPRSRLLLEKLPFLALAALSCAVTLHAQSDALAPGDKLPLVFRVANAARSYAAYLGKAFWPTDPAVLYPLPLGLSIWEALGGALLVLAVSVAVLAARRRCPYLLVGWLWFLGALVPVIGLVQVGVQAYADRYTYLPYVGLFVAVVWGATEAVGRLRLDQRLAAASAAAVLVALGAAAWVQTGHWDSSVSLFRHAVLVTPPNVVARINLGAALSRDGLQGEAFEQFLEAVRIDENSWMGHFNLGLTYRELGDLDRAIWHLRRSLRINPGFAPGREELYWTLYERGARERR